MVNRTDRHRTHYRAQRAQSAHTHTQYHHALEQLLHSTAHTGAHKQPRTRARALAHTHTLTHTHTQSETVYTRTNCCTRLIEELTVAMVMMRMRMAAAVALSVCRMSVGSIVFARGNHTLLHTCRRFDCFIFRCFCFVSVLFFLSAASLLLFHTHTNVSTCLEGE